MCGWKCIDVSLEIINEVGDGHAAVAEVVTLALRAGRAGSPFRARADALPLGDDLGQAHDALLLGIKLKPPCFSRRSKKALIATFLRKLR